jgi:hypothetical protein
MNNTEMMIDMIDGTRLPRRGILFAVGALLLLGCAGNGGPKARAQAQGTELWTESERQAVVAYWSAEGRYKVEPSPDTPQRLNITVPGSTWYWTYNRAVPSVDKETAAQWADWVMKRLAADRAAVSRGGDVPAPGPIPDALKAAVGEPPPFYENVRPLRYTVTFAKEDAPEPFIYTDNIPFADRRNYFPSYRSTNGVIRPGKRVKDYTGDDLKKLEALFASVGRTESEGRVLKAVSALEGGFEAINTYDTGFVSIGFIQFITAKEGRGSLAAVMARHKQDNPAEFATNFRRFGIDVTADTTMAAVHPVTGQIVTGPDAVRAIIDDKRLTAIFERAGATDAFRKAQVAIARERYWPGDDTVTVMLGNGTQTARVSDLFKSEAGLATLMDRKVNRGNIRPLDDIATKLMQEKKLTTVADLAKFERELIVAMKYRHDYLADPTLSQPATTTPAVSAARNGKRSKGTSSRGGR